ncbi:MAG TPA: paraquat-inducible protein A [Candidatus Binataceae bacterium]|nr:paraquat-inducible protein A [Candidatus Binataceae bacterium]
MAASAYNRFLTDDFAACPDCDLLQRLPVLEPQAAAVCRRCGRELRRYRPDSLNRTLALAAAAATLYVVANAVPMLGLTVVGREAETTVFGGAWHLLQNDQRLVGLLVLFTAVIAPAVQIALTLAVIAGVSRDHPPRWVARLMRLHPTAQTWSMIEVMMLGVLVALVKIADYATVIPGLALFVIGGLVLLLAAMQASFDPAEVWRRVTWVGARDSSLLPLELEATDADGRAVGRSALELGLERCDTCGLVSQPVGAESGRCPRCGAAIEFRKAEAFQRAWAFLIAAAICYVPANLLPVLRTTTDAGTDSDTILQGVVLLWSPRGWPLSLIVLVASIVIPSAKIAALAYLLITAQRGSAVSFNQRVRLYRTVEFIGRWSMVDVFVDTFTAALIQLQPLMSVEPGPGLVFFAAVVVLTMLAVESFDPRLIWDPAIGRGFATKEAGYA